MRQEKPFVIRRTRNKQFRVYLFDTDGRQLAISEAYNRKASAKRCIYRVLYLDRNVPYSTILRLVKDRDTNDVPTYHFQLIGRNSEIVMWTGSVSLAKAHRMAEVIINITDSFDPDTMTGAEFYSDESYIRKPKANGEAS
jgi:uncharacterized protein YegP (UPF0339 family)